MAERDFDEGELIFHENALGVGPNPESTLQCILCSKKACITQTQCLVNFGQFWRVFENLKFAVKQCYQTGQF